MQILPIAKASNGTEDQTCKRVYKQPTSAIGLEATRVRQASGNPGNVCVSSGPQNIGHCARLSRPRAKTEVESHEDALEDEEKSQQSLEAVSSGLPITATDQEQQQRREQVELELYADAPCPEATVWPVQDTAEAMALQVVYEEHVHPPALCTGRSVSAEIRQRKE
jgi:hypothetical protein